MDHEGRISLAENIKNYLLEKFGDEVLLGGIYGSTARHTDTEHSDLEMFFVVKDESEARSFSFAYEHMPVNVAVRKLTRVERDISEIELDWPLKMGRLFNLQITCGDSSLLRRLRHMLEKVPDERFYEFIGKATPICFEGLGRLKSVKTRGNTHETGLFVAEVLVEFTLLIALFNREFINHDYLGGLSESSRFKKLPKDHAELARELVNWVNLTIDEIIQLADQFVMGFVDFMEENGVSIRTHTPVERLDSGALWQ